MTDAAPDARAARRARLDAARRDLCEATARGEGGRQALKQYSQRMDVLVQQLFAAAAPPARLVAVFALGGYGRRQLCLHSDIDLLILFGAPLTPQDERFLQTFLNPIWDFGLTIGHHVRDVSDGDRLPEDNAEFLLALTDARAVAGDETLLDQFLESTEIARTRRTTDALRALVSERHARFNDTLYQLEPDVKEAPGGLRDLFAAQTIARLTDRSLLGEGGSGLRALDDAEEFLFRVRSVLHFETKRHHNILGHELQERVANTLGYPGSSPRRQVERLMGDYFRHARAIDRTLRWTLKAAPTPVGPNLVQTAGEVKFMDAREAAGRPETWLALFQAAIDTSTSVSDESLATIEQNVGRFRVGDFLPSPAHKQALLHFLKPKVGLYARLTEMHDAGLLGQIFPEFKGINFLVVRDFYHKYTVDEHTLLTIRTLERLTEFSGDRERFSRLLLELESPELLVLSLLYHDVGKGRGQQHAVESRRLAGIMLERLGLDADARATVEFLVAEHLKMSLVAFRRDTEDPEIVRQFAGLVGVEERLKQLCLLTLSDVEAVSPDTLTPWKQELLWRLYVDTYNHLTLSYGDEVIDPKQAAQAALIDQRPPDVSAGEIATFLEGLPRRYLQLFSSEAVYRHVRQARDLKAGSVKAWIEPAEDAYEVTVLTHDRPFLFSNISGVLSSYGMDILRGFAFTKPDGLVVDMFHFTDDERFFELNEGGQSQVIKTLEDAILGRKDIATRLKGREEGAFRKKLPVYPPVLHWDNESSRRYTILEIIAENALGLLYRVSRAMSESGVDVDLVLIATEGRRAIDVFHLTRGSAKLSSGQQAELTETLQRVLEGRP